MATATEQVDDQADERQLTTHEWVYAGRCTLSTGKLGSRWFDHTGTERIFAKQPADRIIGGVFTVETSDNATRAVIGSAKYGRKTDAHDDATVDQWRAEDRAAYLEDAGRRERSKLERESANLEGVTLGSLRREMLLRGGASRAALLVAVIGYLEGGR